MTRHPTAVRIVALGSPHGDDRVAWVVAERLASEPALRGSIFKIDSPYQLVDHFSAGCPVILLDACRSGAAAESSCVDEKHLTNFRRTDFRLTAARERRNPPCRALGVSLAGLIILAVEIEDSAPGGNCRKPARIARWLEEHRARNWSG
jgi:hypothetical protein